MVQVPCKRVAGGSAQNLRKIDPFAFFRCYITGWAGVGLEQCCSAALDAAKTARKKLVTCVANGAGILVRKYSFHAFRISRGMAMSGVSRESPVPRFI